MSDSLTVGIQTDRLHWPANGPRRYRRELCRHLLRQRDPASIVPFQFSDAHHPVLDEVGRVERLPRLPGLAERRLDALGCDVIHLDAGLHRFPLVGRLTAAVVATVHGIEPLTLPDHDAPLRVRLQKRHIWPRLIGGTDRVIAVSRALRSSLLRHYPLDQDDVNVVYNGVDHLPAVDEAGNSDGTATVAGFALEQPYVLTVNSYQPRKNAETLVSAFDRLADEVPHALVIGGPGWDDEAVTALIERSPHRDRIHRLGLVPEADLPSLYRNAELFLSTTRHENFGLTIAEAMANGTPVVASGVYAVPEVVGDAGVLIDDPDDVDAFAEAAIDLLGDDDRRAALAAAGRERVGRFTWDRCARETWSVYRAAAGR